MPTIKSRKICCKSKDTQLVRLAELIDHIEIHQAETVPGGQSQRIVIFCNCIGSIEIPEEVDIPLPQITMKTRQGVAVTYNPLPLATV